MYVYRCVKIGPAQYINLEKLASLGCFIEYDYVVDLGLSCPVRVHHIMQNAGDVADSVKFYRIVSNKLSDDRNGLYRFGYNGGV